MASRFAFGERGSGSGRSAASGEALGTAPGLNSAFHIVTSGGSGRVGRCGCLETRRTAWGGFADTHNRLSFRCQSVVWFLTLRPGAIPGPVVCYLPQAFPDCRTRGSKHRVLPQIQLRTFRTRGSKRRVLKTEHRACSHNPRERPFWLNPLILNGLSQLDDYWTRSSKNGEYGPNRE